MHFQEQLFLIDSSSVEVMRFLQAEIFFSQRGIICAFASIVGWPEDVSGEMGLLTA
jgi:hypothetical protein